MSEVRYKVYDLQSAQDEFDIVMEILEDNEALLSNLSTDLEEYSGEAVQKLIGQINEFASMHSQMLSDMDVAKTEIKEIETTATEKFEPLNVDKIMVLHTDKVKAALKGIGSVLDSNLSECSLAASSHFIAWSNNRDRELNDGIYEAILNPIDEFRQRKAEEVYRSNKTTYEQAYTAYIDDMTFHTEIDYFESVVKDIEGVTRSEFPLITDGTLYENLFEDAVGVTYSDFKQTTIDKYVIDTNGFMPYSILGQLALGAAVIAGILFGGEIIVPAGTELIEILGVRNLFKNEYIYQMGKRKNATLLSQSKSNVLNGMTFGYYGFLGSFSDKNIYNARIVAMTFYCAWNAGRQIRWTGNINGSGNYTRYNAWKRCRRIPDLLISFFNPIPSFFHFDDEFEDKIDNFFGGDYIWEK